MILICNTAHFLTEYKKVFVCPYALLKPFNKAWPQSVVEILSVTTEELPLAIQATALMSVHVLV